MGELYKLDFANGKSYIGITTKTSKERFAGHRRGARNQRKCTLLAKAWAKYGEPTLTTLAVLEDDDLAAAEVRAIKAFGTLHPGGYNMLEGGQLSPMKDLLVRKKVSEAKKGKAPVAAVAANIGRKAREGTRNAMSESQKESWKTRAMTDGHKAALLAANKGRKMTDSQKKKLLMSHIGVAVSEETKAKISASLKGRPRSDEAKRNMSEAAKQRWAKQRNSNV